jgi:enoyl-CoA hydratase/carnithine racemase
MSEGQVVLSRRGSVAEIRFSNPAKYNAMSLGMWQEFAQLVTGLHGDGDVRVLVLRGEGEKAFISGADISEFDTNRSAESGSATYDRAVEAAQNVLINSPFPVVANIHGVCMGGGLGLVTACDLRYATYDARFRMPAARLGLGYGHTGIERMVHVLGAARVADLFFTARAFDGNEALRIGLVQDVLGPSELDAKVAEVAQMIASNAPLTVRLAKASINLALGQPAASAVAEIEKGRAVCLASSDYAEGRRAFAEKRAPVFTGT